MARGRIVIRPYIETTAWPFTGQAVFIIYQAFSRVRVMVGRSQTSEGPKYWIAPG